MAAGLGFKTFTTGEVLTAADVNGYLMQGVLVFASEAARNAAITSPQEGQFAFTKDNNSLWYYTGSAWEASGATGDIEGVTAGTGISGGGTSGTVTITNSMATEIDAKGDLIVGTGADTFARLAVGTNGHTLVADSSVSPTGLKWGIPNFVGVGLTNDGTVAMTANVTKFLDFTTETFDTNAFHDNSSNQSRITIPAGYGGKYAISGYIAIGGAGSNSFTIFLRKNGSANPIPGGIAVLQPNNAGNTSADSFSVVIDLVATDYIELGLRLTSTTNYTVQALFAATFLGTN